MPLAQYQPSLAYGLEPLHIHTDSQYASTCRVATKLDAEIIEILRQH